MAESFSLEEVIRKIQDSDDDEMLSANGEGEREKEEDKLGEWLKTFPADISFNRALFEDVGREVLRPLIRQCSCCTEDVQSRERSKAARLLSTSSISAASVLYTEAALWLKTISRRLCGRVAIRAPYTGRIQRQIPQAVFAAVRRMVRTDGNFTQPICYVASNRKGEVISFTSLSSVVRFFSLLTGKETAEVKRSFSRKLKGNRSGHSVKLLVSPEKDFALVYRNHTGKLDICFHYGEWNAYSFPLHNCDL